MFTGLILNPDILRFEELVFDHVLSIEVDRAASRTAEDWSDLGPHAALIDTPELRTTIRLTRRLGSDSLGSAPAPGRLGTLTFYTSPHHSDANRKRIRIRCVITAVEHKLLTAGAKEVVTALTAEQTITALAVSTDGATDPITLDDPPIGE